MRNIPVRLGVVLITVNAGYKQAGGVDVFKAIVGLVLERRQVDIAEQWVLWQVLNRMRLQFGSIGRASRSLVLDGLYTTGSKLEEGQGLNERTRSRHH